MSDTPVDSNPYRSAADRARDRWIHVPIQDRYEAGMSGARAERETRRAVAASRAVALARELAGAGPQDRVREEVMWEVRGEPRTRATFGLPHPGDFPGCLPLPAEYPG